MGGELNEIKDAIPYKLVGERERGFHRPQFASQERLCFTLLWRRLFVQEIIANNLEYKAYLQKINKQSERIFHILLYVHRLSDVNF